MGKAEITSEYILEKVAPYFNMHGYHGTSMGNITAITGLSKGAIYGNFKSKEDLALQAFRYNIKKLLNMLAKKINVFDKSYEQLLAITNFYRDYIDFTAVLGGCPILKVGMDSIDNNPELREKVKTATYKLKKSIEDIILRGQKNHEIKSSIDAEKFANVIYANIEGGVLLSSILNDVKPLHDNIDFLESTIKEMAI